MKKIVLSLVLLLLAVTVVSAAETEDAKTQDIRRFQLQNTFIGFGTGSRHQGDVKGASTLLGLDIAGTALTVSGALALTGSIIVYDMVRGYAGDVTKADIWISAGVLGAGLVTLIVSRALGISYPIRY